MKTKDFNKILVELGFQIVRESDHTIWGNNQKTVAIPHGKEINRMVARRILKELNYTKAVPEINWKSRAA